MKENSQKPLLIVIAGPNGSGKTSVTHLLLHHEWTEGALYVNPDIIAQERFGDWNDKNAVLESVKYCERLREDCLASKSSLIFETVLSGSDKVEFIQRAVDAGYFVRLFFICTNSPRINASRIARRVMEGGHDVPITKVVSRYMKSIANCIELQNIVDRLYLYDNSIDNQEARLLCRFSKGELIKQYTDDIPQWASSFL